jgi:hypothetical protein
MSSIKAAVEILHILDDFLNIQLIAKLNWKSIPEAYTHAYSCICQNHKVDVYKRDAVMIVEIQGIGLFQIM